MTFRFRPTFEGMLANPEGTPPDHHVTPLTAELRTWLEDLLILRGIPLSYILPDPELLPPESIRFFHIDPTWIARVIDGAFSAASLGVAKVAVSPVIISYLRREAERCLATRLFPREDGPTLPMLSGMLMRSEIVRRWPGLTVTALEGKRALVLARKERLASGLMIVIFAGVPTRVEIAEPAEGTRYGLEPKGTTWSIQLRNHDGSFMPNNETAGVTLRSEDTRVVDIASLVNSASASISGSAHLSLCLQQQPFVQIFEGSGPDEYRRTRKIRELARARKIALSKVQG